MPRVDFHSQVGSRLNYCCRLTRKVLSLSPLGQALKQVIVIIPQAELGQLDSLLWSFSADDFLPHCQIDDELAIASPILLTSSYNRMLFDQVPHSDVLIHMGSQPLTEIVELANRFERVVEIVSTNELDLIAGRERFKHYRSLGLELTNYDQKGAA